MALLTAEPAQAGHYNPSGDSVDNGEIRFENYTKYDPAWLHARSEWNNLGSVDIVPDDASHIADLEVRDADACGASWDGQWVSRSGADLLEFNDCYFKNYSWYKRSVVSAHETGDALGLGDHESADYQGILMYYCCFYTNVPEHHDKVDYHNLWG